MTRADAAGDAAPGAEELLDEFASDAEVEGSVRGDRRRRRIARVVAIGVVVAVLAAGVLWFVRSRPASDPQAEPPPFKTASVMTQDIVNVEVFDGTISYASAQPFVARQTGRVTALADEGVRLQLGDTVFAVDGVPTVLFYGDVPAWRDLSSSSSPGPDIAELEQSLVSLGFDPDGRVTVDDSWSAATTDAVKRWQRSLGVEQTGEVVLGSVVFEPTSVAMGRHQVSVGGSVTGGGTVAGAKEPGLVMTFAIGADNRALIAIGQQVEVTMPDRSSAKGEISSIGTQQNPLDGSTVTVATGRVTPREGSAPPPDQAPIKVRVTQTVAQGVVVVPATAITSYVDGHYSVTIVDAAGSGTVVPVEVGVTGGGFVEVRGEGVRPGVDVAVPNDY